MQLYLTHWNFHFIYCMNSIIILTHSYLWYLTSWQWNVKWKPLVLERCFMMTSPFSLTVRTPNEPRLDWNAKRIQNDRNCFWIRFQSQVRQMKMKALAWHCGKGAFKKYHENLAALKEKVALVEMKSIKKAIPSELYNAYMATIGKIPFWEHTVMANYLMNHWGMDNHVSPYKKSWWKEASSTAKVLECGESVTQPQYMTYNQGILMVTKECWNDELGGSCASSTILAQAWGTLGLRYTSTVQMLHHQILWGAS
jgi:hypothetical protein